MATTRLWCIKNGLKRSINYVVNEAKTVGDDASFKYILDNEIAKKQYVTCINCNFADPYSSMINTKKQFNDDKEIEAFHGYQSFVAKEVDVQKAHEIGVETANRLWGNRFEIIVTTHLDKDHVHNHFLFNSTSFVDGKRFCNSYKDIHNLRDTSDEICREYGLSVIENPSVEHNFLSKKRLGELYKRAIDESISHSLTLQQFEKELLSRGFELNGFDDSMSIKHPDAKQPMRLKRLGYHYTFDRIKERILDREINPSSYSQKGFDTDFYIRKLKRNELPPLQRLFIHYQFLLGILPKNNTRRKHYSKETAMALRSLDQITNQTTFICKNNLETLDDVNQIRINCLKQLKSLFKERQQLYYQLKKAVTPEDKAALREQLRSLNTEIKALRSKVNICDGIADRSTHIEDFFKKNYEQIQQNKRKIKERMR